MDFSLMMAYALVNTMSQEARSALPDAPIVAARAVGSTTRRLARLRGWLATALQRAAWAIEPAAPTTVAENRQ